MSGPGKGRYTDYVGTQSSKLTRLHKLFNKNPMSNDKGLLYGADSSSSNQAKNTAAADFTVKEFTIRLLNDYGYKGIVKHVKNDKTSFMYFAALAPDTKKLANNIKDPPANSYMPLLSSPGANAGYGDITVLPRPNFDRLFDEKTDVIDPGFFKNYKLIVSPDTIDDVSNLGTVSPSVSSIFVGLSSLGNDLQKGSSKRE